MHAGAQASTGTPVQPVSPSLPPSQPFNTAAWQKFAGLPLRRIAIEGVTEERLSSLHLQLAQTVGEPLSPDKVSASLRLLYATGLFDSIEAAAEREGGGVVLIFRGAARAFIGRITVEGAKGATINTQLERTGRLNPGTRYSEARMQQAIDQMRELLVSNGFYESSIKYTLTPNTAEQLVDIFVKVTPGPQARVGTITVTGDTGISLDEFRKYSRLVPGRAIDHDTVNRALEGVLKHYQKERRLEADVKLQSHEYVAHRVNYSFSATRGPIVNVHVEGVKLNDSHIKRLVPIYEEGSVDEDLLNEGGRRIRNYYQSQGYFDVKVDHTQQEPAQDLVLIDYNVQLGARRKVESVKVDGNHYFDAATLKELLNVHAANALDRQGAYSQSLVTADIAALSDTYKNNGFSKVSITPETGPQASTGAKDPVVQTGRPAGKIFAPLTVTYHITEGAQQRVGTVTLTGNDHVSSQTLTPLMNTVQGQLLSPRNLAGDRDVMLNQYLSQGFNDAHIDVEEVSDTPDADKVDVVFHIVEGSQTFVRKVLLTGLHYTRPSTVAKGVTIKAGDPLNQQALQETQKNLYNYALFNEVDTAIQNPNGGETEKTVLLQTVEARRWTLTYGAGFEAQTGTPQNNCAGLIAAGVECSANGHTGVSLRGLASITRNNLFGREQSASISGNYGTLEQRVDLIYQYPHLLGAKNFGLTFSGGYANSQAVTTYVASRLDAGLRLTQKFNGQGRGLFSRANIFVYEFDFRRVKVDENSIQVYPAAVAELSSAVRVGGPGFTWIRDTRDNPTDATRGSYTSFQEFISSAQSGAQAQFNRIDLSNSSYYTFDKGKIVFARNTRYGQERAFGNASGELLPLPERLYAGGATSLRGFSSNAAGPRDPQTGFPIGGAGALINSLELRLPPPTLPYFGNTLSFVLFHDMGNVFTNAGDIWASAIRVRQPDRDTCKILTQPNPGNPPLMPLPPGPSTSTGLQGACSFNYFSHTLGLGLRYHTPVGPVRFDFSYNLNPPIYPVDVNYSQTNPYENQHVGQAGHFNFFFSLGQTF
ncbi:outer membrane protein assembly factor [Terracidiphilus gabretensis]|uniref:POTRA domain-containing protein n=1 Tax=Terracidiphilus gabretensis TaxID=1577687 RepID=UPI00071BB507|nr:outer membrane protein assembly factor [Terracidiphilus gabretensis]